MSTSGSRRLRVGTHTRLAFLSYCRLVTLAAAAFSFLSFFLALRLRETLSVESYIPGQQDAAGTSAIA